MTALYLPNQGRFFCLVHIQYLTLLLMTADGISHIKGTDTYLGVQFSVFFILVLMGDNFYQR